MKKLRDSRGESLVEVLAAVLVTALSIMFLATAVVSAARVNTRLTNADVAFQVPTTPEPGDVQVKSGSYEENISVSFYKTDNNSYCYYQK